MIMETENLAGVDKLERENSKLRLLVAQVSTNLSAEKAIALGYGKDVSPLVQQAIDLISESGM